MAKARADGTPAKASGKKKATTSAKKANTKSESPERRVTSSSQRRTTLSSKAQEAAAAAEKVQTGRLTKITSPAKVKASPAKAKASPAKAKASPAKEKTSPAKAKAQTPPKKKAASPASAKATKATKLTKAATPKTKAPPYKVFKAIVPPSKKAASPAGSGGKRSTKKTTAPPTKATKASSPKKKETVTPTRRTVSQILAGPPKKGENRPVPKDDHGDTLLYSIEVFESLIPDEEAEDMRNCMDKLHALELHDELLEQAYSLLESALGLLREHDDQGYDAAQMQRMRPVSHRLWTALRDIVGDDLDECLERGIPAMIFRRALVSSQRPRKKIWSREEGKYYYGWAVEDIAPLDFEDVLDEFEEDQRRFVVRDARFAAPSPAKRTGSVSRKSASPAKRAKSQSPAPAPASVPTAAAPSSERARSKSPAKCASSPKEPSSDAGSEGSIPDYTHQNVRGEIVSPTNPVMISALNKCNPFHETLPAPEVWHRRMPPYFNFGETPYMQSLVSQQIQEDLDRNTNERTKAAQAKESWVLKKATSVLGSLGDMLSPAKRPRGYPSPWDLPDVSDSELDSERELVKPSSRRRSAASRGSTSRKPSSPKKMPPRETEDEDASDNGDFMMAGGLH